MSAKNILSGQSARSRLLAGANKMARAVSTTYGPLGRTCVMDRMGGLLITKDGVTVAREIELPDHIENQGAAILKNACIRVNDSVGDGTTTVAIIASSIMAEGHKMILTGGVDPMGMVRGINAGRDKVIEAVRNMVHVISTQEELQRVAMLASNGDMEVSSNLAEACMAVGKDGTVTVEDGVGLETTLEFREGMEIDQGPCSELFLNGGSDRTINSPLVAVIHSRLRSLADVQDLMETASQWPDNELVVFCLIAEAEALSVMTVNNSKGVMKCIAIGAPGVQFRKVEYLEDIAAMSGATMVDQNAGMDHRKWDPEWFGTFKQISVNAKSTVMASIPEAQVAIDDRIEALHAQESSSVSDYDRDRLKERMAKLSGGLAVLKVGGATELAMKERRARVEDALGAVRASLRSGVVPGGGISYLRASQLMDITGDGSFFVGQTVLKSALARPLIVLANNAGENGHLIVDKVMDKWRHNDSGWFGWDATTSQYRDLSDDPLVMDPTDVVIAVINAAVSVATTLLTVETAIALVDNK